jgi:hypothetical protein
VTEVDPDPRDPADAQQESVLGDRELTADGDPTQGGKRGEVGDTSSVRSDEPGDGQGYPVGGGSVTEESDAPPAAGSGAGA